MRYMYSIPGVRMGALYVEHKQADRYINCPSKVTFGFDIIKTLTMSPGFMRAWQR